jgi:hypothetical protein
MMTGVLVIAFPVSVFSDLWSKELKRSGALSALDEDEDDDEKNDAQDDGSKDLERARNTQSTPTREKFVKFLSTTEEEPPATPTQPDASHNFISDPNLDEQPLIVDDLPHPNTSNSNIESLVSPSGGMDRRSSSSSLSRLNNNQVAIDKDDLMSLLANVQSIQESQREIKLILRKYKMQM